MIGTSGLLLNSLDDDKLDIIRALEQFSYSKKDNAADIEVLALNFYRSKGILEARRCFVVGMRLTSPPGIGTVNAMVDTRFSIIDRYG